MKTTTITLISVLVISVIGISIYLISKNASDKAQAAIIAGTTTPVTTSTGLSSSILSILKDL
jgi:uncharacterized protein YxeA